MSTFWQRLRGIFHKPVAAIPTTDNGQPTTFPSALISVARGQALAAIRETSRNQGPGIQKYWTATTYGPAGYLNREPWCAAFLAWVVKQAARVWFDENPPFALPRSAAVLDWPRWAAAQAKWTRLDASKNKVQPGDIICWDFNGADSGGTHIGLATSAERANGTFDTIEGNTNSEGSRDGNGVYARTTRTRRSAIALLRYVG